MTETDSIEINNKTQHSKWNMTAYSFSGFSTAVNSTFVSFYYVFFFEVEIGLSIVFISLALSLNAIWNGLNDPLIGYLSDKTRWYTRRWGRRFPLILFGTVPFGIFTILLFFPPSIDPASNPIPLFLYLLFIILIQELFKTIQYVNRIALYPQKYRKDNERRYISGMQLVAFSIVSIIAQFIPSLFIVKGNIPSYQMGAIYVALIGLPAIIFIVLGGREDKEMIEKTLQAKDKHYKDHKFIPTLKLLIKNRNFHALLGPAILATAASMMADTARLYFAVFIMGLQIRDLAPVIIVSGVIIFPLLPLGLRINKKIGFVRTYILGQFSSVLNLVVFLFIILTTGSIIALYIYVIWMIFSSILVNTSDLPLYGWFLDEITVQEKSHIEGFVGGIRWFLLFLAAGPINFIILAITHDLLGFDPNLTVQTPLAELGIYLHGAIIPIIFRLIAIVLFWKFWNITKEKADENKRMLTELNL